MLVERKEYLNSLKQWKDKQIIKVITGIRRCGKSTLMIQFQQWLKTQGILDEQIISVNLEDLEYEELHEYQKMYQYISGKIQKDKKMYVFIDEVQMIDNFEKVVDSLFIKENVDVYITGSNSYMLSGDLATYLSGRHIEIKMLSLSFKEYFSLKGGELEAAFAEYMKNGGMPYLASIDATPEMTTMYMEGIYNTVIVKDIEDRENRLAGGASIKKITDITLLKTIAKYLSSVIGSPVSINSVTNYFKSNGRKISPNTVGDYIRALTESFVFYQAVPYDIRGKQLLNANSKYYIVDLGIRNHILPRKKYDFGFTVENIVYFELLRRGYQVNIGRFNEMEVDFVASKNDRVEYIQVTASMTAEETFQREIRPLRKIEDNFKKTILTCERFSVGNYDGIEVSYLIDWLMDK